MKQKILTFIMMISTLWISHRAYAYDFQVDGIRYTITSFDDFTVTVDGLSENVSGIVEIPSVISYKDRSFTVTSIKSIRSTNIESVLIPSTVTSLSDYAFSRSSIKKIVIPDNVTKIGKGLCQNCESLIYVSMPSNISYLPHYSFKGCKSLKKFDWHRVKNGADIGPRAFEGCISLTSFTIPAAGKWGSSTGGNWDGSVPYQLMAFYGCSSLDTLIIGDSKGKLYLGADDMEDNTKNEFDDSPIRYLYIGSDYVKNTQYAVSKFKRVEHLVIGDSVSSLTNWPSGNLKTLEIGSNLSKVTDFSKNTTLEYIKVKRTNPPTAMGFSNYNFINTILYVPRGCKAIYESRAIWKNFWNIQEFDITSNIPQISADAVRIQSKNGIISILGVDKGKDVVIYTVSGQIVGSTKGNGNQISLITNIKKGEIAIIKIGEKTLKTVMQ